MKFTKPISREVDIDGNTFIVSFDQNGIDFRVKGKRKIAHTDWNKVLEIAKGEDGTSAHELLGVSTGQTQENEPESHEQRFAPQTSGFNQSEQSNAPQLQSEEVNTPQWQEDSNAQPQASQTSQPGETKAPYSDTTVNEYSQEERSHQASATTAPQNNADGEDKQEEFGRAVTAGETRQES